eukprot:1892184-Prymnesium_polylepis.1
MLCALKGLEGGEVAKSTDACRSRVARVSLACGPCVRHAALAPPSALACVCGRLRDQNLRVLSSAPEQSRWPSGCHASESTDLSCAAAPYAPCACVSDEPVMVDQKKMVLRRRVSGAYRVRIGRAGSTGAY